MKRAILVSGALVLTLGLANAADADTSQLAASAGLDRSEASRLSAIEIVQIKFNSDTRRDDRNAIERPAVAVDRVAHAQLIAAAGVSPAEAEGLTLSELAMAKSNNETRGDDRRRLFVNTGGTAGNPQLIASVGLKPEIGRAMSLHEIYLEKIVRQSSDD